VEPVAVGLQRVDLRLRDAQPPVPHAERHADVCADVEELVLDAFEHGWGLLWDVTGEDDPEEGVQLVDRPERGDPAIELPDAAAVAEARPPRRRAPAGDVRAPA